MVPTRDFIIIGSITLLCLVAAAVADYVWLGGKYSSKVAHTAVIAVTVGEL
jgi:hypothetical protein